MDKEVVCKKKKLVILTGPTAVGKTDLSVKLAQKIGGEIISADSMQVYRGMDIGSAKIQKEEMQDIPHHLIDVLDPWDEFNVFRFQKMAGESMEKIYAGGHIPILTGGTGFYIQALLYDIDFSPEEENTILRQKLDALAAEKGNPYLHELLKQVDSVSAEKIHPNNRKRIIRALEYFERNGMPISHHNKKERQKEAAYDFCYFVLTDEREKIYRQIDARVERMIAQGLVDEVTRLKNSGCHRGMISMQGIGYREILACLDGEYPLEEAIERIKLDTRHFAKRQLTWFRRERDVTWVDKQQFDCRDERILAFMEEHIRARLCE